MTLVPTIPVLTVPPIEAAGEAILALLIGRYIESSGTAAQQLAKAQQLLGFDVALEEINAGNTAGVADLQTAVQNWVATLTKDPAAQLAWNELAATVTTGLAALESTIIGKLTGATANVFITQAAAVCQYYVTTLSAAAK